MGRGLTAGAAALALLCAMATGGTAAAADCGGLLQPACPATPPPPPPPPPVEPVPEPEPTPAPPLSAARYAALDTALAAQRPLDAADPSPARVSAARAACAPLSTADPLLKAMRGTCLKVVGILREGEVLDRCSTPDGCLRSLNRYVAAFGAWAAANHRQTNAVDRAVKDKACRTALRVSRTDLRIIDRVAPAFRARIAAARTAGEADDRRTQKRLEAIPLGDLRTYASVDRAFRADCR